MTDDRSDAALKEAANLLGPLAEAGDVPARTLLGSLHMSDAEWADPEQGMQLLRGAAEQGSGDAMLELAKLCKQDSNLEGCRDWLVKAANAGSTEAMYAIGHAHELGKLGLGVDPHLAREWYRHAAEAGHEEAKRRLVQLGPLGD